MDQVRPSCGMWHRPRIRRSADLSSAKPIRWRPLAPTPYRSKSPASGWSKEGSTSPTRRASPSGEVAECPSQAGSHGRAARLSEGPGPWSARVKGFATRAPLTLRGPLQKPAWSAGACKRAMRGPGLRNCAQARSYSIRATNSGNVSIISALAPDSSNRCARRRAPSAAPASSRIRGGRRSGRVRG
jgi:hypothetical protein